MSNPYSQETRKILTDFLETLRQTDGLDPVVLSQIEAMVQSGQLADRARVLAIVRDLKGRLHDPSY